LRDAEPREAASHGPARQGHSLAEAFLRAGVRALVGTLHAAADRVASQFASTVHAELAAGRRLGDAVRTARVRLFRDRSKDWGNFLLYGDDDLIV
jgi:hypothetical protein